MKAGNSVNNSATGACSPDLVERVIGYHNRTKHHLNRYARSLGFLDWANQPDPFRRFEGAELLRLPLLKADEEPLAPAYDAIYKPGAVPGRPVTIRTLSRFFEFALALSAWKQAGEAEWALRSNPSSGNLHPTEGYLLVPAMDGLDLKPGLYHYAPKEHGLERRAELSTGALARLFAPFPAGSFMVGLTSIQWREAWKYGERAFRYCHHDVGHAIGTVRIAAATLGWRMVLLDGLQQTTVASLLGTDRKEDFAGVEPEHPDCLALVWPYEMLGKAPRIRDLPLFLDPASVEETVAGVWYGKANRLSREHLRWEIIEEVTEASRKSSEDHRFLVMAVPPPVEASPARPAVGPDAGRIIRQRRSAVAFDGKTSIPMGTFFRMLQRVQPLADRSPLARPMPWDCWPYEPAIHLLLFVHRIDGLTPGIYFLVRDPHKLAELRCSMNPGINWVPAPGSPDGLGLYWLLEGDARRLATQVSCHQDIAGDSAFSLGMLAEFEGPLRKRGGWWYPRLFWESGLLGQVLYLEAEAHGVRATGIGCFFDDPVHEIISVNGLTLQSLYHFTVGGPVEDRRLTTLPPYGHMTRGQ
jgi:SagB-type dehydrogenase family enzyme